MREALRSVGEFNIQYFSMFLFLFGHSAIYALITSLNQPMAMLVTGYSVSNATFNALVQRYSHVDGKVYFDNFVQCVSRMKTMFGE